MKKLLYLLLLLPSLAWGQEYARMNPYILGSGVAAAAACSTSNDTVLESATGWSRSLDLTIDEDSDRFSMSFSNGSNFTLTEFEVNGYDSGGTGSLVGCITSTEGGTCITGTTVTVGNAAIGGVASEQIVFTLSAAVSGFTASTTYYIKLVRSAGAGDFRISIDSNESNHYTNGGVYLNGTDFTTNYDTNIVIRGCE